MFILFNGHGQILNFENTPLDEVLLEVEKQSELSFNFDHKEVSRQVFSGQLDLSDLKATCTKLFKYSSFDFVLNDANILLIQSKRKRYKLCGYIVDDQSGSPLPFANIVLNGSQIGTQSNDDGYFEIEFEAMKNDQLSINYIGYEKRMLYLIDWKRDEDCNVISLSVDVDIFSDEIIIKDYILSGIVEGEEYGSVRLDFNDLMEKSNAHEFDVMKSVQLLPGVQSIDESAQNIYIRGFTPDQNLLSWENATIYDSGHLFGMVSSINPFVIDDVQLQKGVYGPSFKNRIGGIIDISLDDEIENRVSAGIGSNMTENHAYIEVPFKDKFEVTLARRQSIGGILSTPTFSNYIDKVFQETRFEDQQISTDEEVAEAINNISYSDINGKILMKFNDKLKLKLSYLESENMFEYTYEEPGLRLINEDELSKRSQVLSAQMDVNIFNNTSSSVYFSQSDYDNTYSSELDDVESENLFESFSTFNRISEFNAGIKNEWDLNQSIDIDFGYEWGQKEVEYAIDNGSLFENFLSESDFLIGNIHNLFGSIDYRKEKLAFEAGLRVSHYDIQNQFFFGPRGKLQYKLNEKFKLKFGVGHFYQFVSQLVDFSESELSVNNNIWILASDDRASTMTANKFSLGGAYTHKGWLIDADIYRHSSFGISTLSTNLGSRFEIEDLIDAQTVGLDLLIKKNWNNYRTWVNYTLSNNIYFLNTTDVEGFPSNHDRPHCLSWVNNFKWKSLELGVTYHAATGLPYSDPEEIELDDEDEEEENYQFLYESINEERLRSYYRLDASLTFQKRLGKKGPNFLASLSMLNILDRQNEFSRNFIITDTEEDDDLETLSIDKFLLRRTPQLLVRIYW